MRNEDKLGWLEAEDDKTFTIGLLTTWMIVLSIFGMIGNLWCVGVFG